MKPNNIQFLDPGQKFTDLDTAAFAVLPFPYEGGVSYGTGTSQAPKAILTASHYVEFYDEILKMEPYRAGIVTLDAPDIPGHSAEMQACIYEHTSQLLAAGKFTAVIGGDHSISSGYFNALTDKFGPLSVIQLDAHADLRESYEGSALSHASVMARIREKTQHTLQLGIRSMCREEAEQVQQEELALFTMREFRDGTCDLDWELEKLPNPVFLTLDVDALDLSLVWSTGTPEPGGFQWDELLSLLEKIFSRKNVVGFDIVELAVNPADRNSSFVIAKLLYKMLGMALAAGLDRSGEDFPEEPAGSYFSIYR